MPPKRKRKAKNEPTITIVPAEKPIPHSSIESNAKIPIRCVWDSRLVIGADKTITGTRYQFESDQVQSVDYQDYQILISMETKPFGCCGGTVRPQKFFEEV
jgi:hypothetical protein